jgi:hypothetical protein
MGILSSLLTVGGAAIGVQRSADRPAHSSARPLAALGWSRQTAPSGSKKATQAQIDALNQARAIEGQAYTDAKGYQQPYMDFGGGAINALTGRLGIVQPSSAGATGSSTGVVGAQGFGGQGGATAAGQDRALATSQGGTIIRGPDGSGIGYTDGDIFGGSGATPTGADPRVTRFAADKANGGFAGTSPAEGGVVQPATTNALTGAPVGAGPDPGTFGDTANPSAPQPYVAGAPPPGYSGPTSYSGPTNFSYTLSDYKASPAYQYQLDQANNNILSQMGRTGALNSGAALKALSDRAQNIALGDFTNERAFAAGQFNADRNFDYNAFTGDRNFGYGVSRDARSDFQNDRGFGYGQARDARSDYQDTRDYLTGRSDNQTNNLFRAAGVGQGAANALTGAASRYGDQAAGLVTAQGDAQARNALTQGQIGSDLATGLGGVIAGYVGGRPVPANANALTGGFNSAAISNGVSRAVGY